METGEERKSFFDDHYSERRSDESYAYHTVCGVGSTHENIRNMIKILHSLTDQLKRILNKDKIRFLDSSFTGYDLSDSNIEHNKEKHRNLGTFKVNGMIYNILIFLSYFVLTLNHHLSNTTW